MKFHVAIFFLAGTFMCNCADTTIIPAEKPVNTLDNQAENANPADNPSPPEKVVKEPKIDPKLDFKTSVEFDLLPSEVARTFWFQTPNCLVVIEFSDKNSILDYIGEEKSSLGLAKFFKLVIESAESGYRKAISWISQISEAEFNDKIILHINENLSTGKNDVASRPVDFEGAGVINLSLAEVTNHKIHNKIWENLLPIKNPDIKTGVAILQPVPKITDASFYYKFMFASRILIGTKQTMNLTSSYQTKFYNDVRADFSAFLLENSKSLASFYKVVNSPAEVLDYQQKWIENRTEISEADKKPAKYILACLSAQQGHKAESLEILSKMKPTELKNADGGFYGLAQLAFFARKYEFVRRYLEEKFLPVDFYLKKDAAQKIIRVHNQLEIPLSIQLVPIIQGDLKFNKKLAVFYNNLGFRLTAEFMIFAENVFSFDPQIQQIADEDFSIFISKCPENYVAEYTFWFGYLKMLAALQTDNISAAKKELAKLLKLPVSKLKIAAANFLFNSSQK